MKRTWLAVPIVVVLAGAGWWYQSATSGVPVQTERAVQGEIRQYVDELGKTRLPDVYLITMPFAGRIEPITLHEGEAVQAGQVVARVSQADLANELAEARAGLERFEASLVENDDASVELGAKKQAEKYVESMAATVQAAESRERSGKKKLEFSQSLLSRARSLREKGSNSPEDLERAELDFVQSDVDYSQDVLVSQSLRAIQAATLLMPQMVVDYINRKSLTHNVLEKQRAEALARLKQAELRSERGVMASPVDGVVLERPLDDEQFLAAGTLLLKVGQLDQLEVEADVLSQDVGEVRAGDAVEIYGPAVGRTVGRGIPGVVHRVYPAGFTKVSSLGVEEQRVKVIARFAAGELAALRSEREIGVDYRVRLRVFTELKTGALVVPRSALFRSPDGQWQVFVVRNGQARLQDVQVGLLNDDQAELVSGVAETERVVLAPEHDLKDGSRVKVIDEAGQATPAK